MQAQPGQVPLAFFFPASAGIDLHGQSGLCVLHTPALRGYDPAPLVEPGITIRPLEPPSPSPPAILYWDDRDDTLRSPIGSIGYEYDAYVDDREGEEAYDDSLEEPAYSTKIGGFPCFPQGAEQLIAGCTRCGTPCVFILQLAGNEAIDLGDGSLFIFMCPHGCEYRSKFQR